MTSIAFYFQIHQPYRLKRYTFFDIGRGGSYFDDDENKRILQRVADKCYVPMNELLLEQIEKHDGKFRFAMAITGTVLEQMERWHPAALESFVRLTETGCVEIVCETSHHSLAFLSDPDEFDAQVLAQRTRIEELFGQRAVTFRNTELVINNEVAEHVEALGFSALLGEGADQLLGIRSSHEVYRPATTENLSLLLRTYERADDIAFRFSNQGWDKWPLTAATFAKWLADVPGRAKYTGLFMDYETFGEHQWRETGIFDFMEQLPALVIAEPTLDFKTPSEIVAAHPPKLELDIPRTVSWADAERDLTAWLGNHMQREANRLLYELGPDVRRAAERGHPEMLEDWRRLTTSDHVYYMCTKYFSDGDVHKYFSPYSTPHDAFIAFMNVLSDLKSRVRAALESPDSDREELKAAKRLETTTPPENSTRKLEPPTKAPRKDSRN
ncbi:MAG: alpha-amylase [Planctomycetota bacterium]|jgi:alpha-amylase